MSISVTIIAKNEAAGIAACIKSAQALSDDIIVADSGSSDDTVAIAKACGAKVIEITWNGYGAARNAASQAAKYDWIFAIDADERLSEGLAIEIAQQTNQSSTSTIGWVKRANFFNEKMIRFGDWGSDEVARFYHKGFTKWDNALVHETLILEKRTKLLFRNELNHYTAFGYNSFLIKNLKYAQLSALNYAEKGKKGSYFKLLFSPFFTFFKGYFLRFGFLDGLEGFWIAKINATYVFAKYAALIEINKNSPR
jgi:glycosyltransferase involved in cell wall biosynthesis